LLKFKIEIWRQFETNVYIKHRIGCIDSEVCNKSNDECIDSNANAMEGIHSFDSILLILSINETNINSIYYFL
jgi:hypothetical protein